ncbi:MAG TPA: NAD-dependent DNA ligase LigA, partial [Elusimicrobiota bacterium]|nr:NAD-dependent DNA ligase LigA [Elusimicrobiota bacterium]
MPLSKDPAREIRKLRAEIREHDRLYYGQNRPIVSDEEYDRLLERLRALEAENPELISSDSPTQRVGGSASNEFQPVPHAVPMLSLDNSYDAADIRAFDERVRKGLGRAPAAYAVEAKIDGVSLALTYLDGHLAVAATRGDGATGEDVTLNARTLRSIPLALSGKEFPHVLEIRGEVYLEKREFARINARLAAEGKEPFVNPRNCASGSLRQKDPKATAARGLRFLAHSFGRIAGAEPPPTHSGFLEACADWGFAVT